ncbi:isoprenylcysteine carboxylmethyltransferase family protein [Nocardioides speluncae]|uniref:isoprenylcysteine carboxylmethyltransferase family protein n=1 Tax=Nocardioides speluncae TaxID=2670337 RepID=UPI001379923B|nr:isoprenylcysteine carboxylmethyltransferase family protein [Nocardioides speluncae]
MTDQYPRRAATAIRAFSVFAYLAFWVSAGWGIVFLADVRLLPTVDTAGTRSGTAAVAVDLALLLVFAVHHSVAARPSVKARLARFVPAPMERSLFVLVASGCLALVFWQWQSLPATVWHVDAQPWVAVLWTTYLVSWLGVIASTLPTGHFEFLGLRQAGWFRRDRTPAPSSLAVGSIYAWVRHPMMFFLLITFWVTPHMSVGHLLFALAGSGYIGVGILFEEADLRRQYGAAYRDYASRVPALLPRRPRSGRVGSEVVPDQPHR